MRADIGPQIATHLEVFDGQPTAHMLLFVRQYCLLSYNGQQLAMFQFSSVQTCAGRANGDVMTCVNANYGDEDLANSLQLLLQYARIGNNFVSADYSFGCGNADFDDFQTQCRVIGGTETCKPFQFQI